MILHEEFADAKQVSIPLGMGSNAHVSANTAKAMIQVINKYFYHPYVRYIAELIVERVEDRDEVGEASAIFNFIQSNTRYGHDPRGREYFQSPVRVLKRIEVGEVPTLDCLPLTQKIIVQNKETQNYEIVEIGTLKECYQEYNALSYDFDRKEFVFKPITAWIDKGVKEVYQVDVRGKSPFYCTENHKLFTYEGQTKPKVQVRRLKDIDTTRSWKRRILFAKQIPILNNWEDKSLDELWVEGHYTAEGWCQTSKYDTMAIANDDPTLRQKLIGILTNLGIPHTPSKRLVSAYVNVLKCEYKKVLKSLGTSSFDMHFPSKYYGLSQKQIEAVLKGFGDGDGYYPKEDSKWYNKAKVIYNTSSDGLAESLKMFHLLIGTPLSSQYQLDHMGVGRKPIWRLYDRIMSGKFSHTANSEIMPNMTSTSIKKVSSIGKKEVCDITVEGTHNFVLDNGCIAHNCDDYTLTSLSLLRSLGYQTAIRIAGYKPNKKYVHVYGLVRLVVPEEGTKWIVFDAVKKGERLGWEGDGITIKRDFIVK